MSPEETVGLSLDVNPSAFLTNPNNVFGLTLALDATLESTTSLLNPLGLAVDLVIGGEAGEWRIVWVWAPFDQPKYTAKNYTYECVVTKSAVEVENVTVRVAFEGVHLTEKTSNATGQFSFWAVVGSPGWHVWRFTLIQDGATKAVIYKDTEYVDASGEEPPEEPEPPDLPDDFPDEPGEGMAFTMSWLPWAVVFGLFAVIGHRFLGPVGILVGGVAGLVVLVWMGDLPPYVLFFLLLVTILIIVYKLKKGSTTTNVMVEANGA
jgi:hypothetical protein